jgi:hypothetical protein
MLSKFKLQTLKQKLWAIVATSIIARIIVFFALPSTPSSLAPDEKTYAFLAKWVGESQPVSQFPSYGEGLFLSSRSLILPSSLIHRTGLNELDAVRMTATMYGILTLVLVVLFILKIHTYKITSNDSNNNGTNWIVGLFFIFAFLPSHFIWSSLALRESATEFWLIAAFISFFVIFHHQKKLTFRFFLLLFTSIVLTFSARPQVGWVLSVSLLVFLMLNYRNLHSYFLIPLVLSAMLFGGTMNSISSDNNASITEVFLPLTSAGDLMSTKHQGNQENAASVIQTQRCPAESINVTSTPPTKLATYFCIAWRAPYMVSTFLFRPIVGVDVTSNSSLIAAVENIFWFSLFVMIVILFYKRRLMCFIAPILPAMIFFALYVLGASAYQGNMGTGFRHKSLILWVVLLVIFALAWKKNEDRGQNQRINSQESAV